MALVFLFRIGMLPTLGLAAAAGFALHAAGIV
jgi:hypothetical protein